QCPLFLNWQGYIDKKDLIPNFDGKIFQKYGVKWHTLRLRIQRLNKQKKDLSLTSNAVPVKIDRQLAMSKAEKCQELLKNMAKRADGSHRFFIETCASQNLNQGIELLEAIYSRLITFKDRPETCPSRYINSSPVIAARILQQT